MAATKTARATSPCQSFLARPGSLCATCGWRQDRHAHPVLTGFGFRTSTRRNGGDWIAITRLGALVTHHVLRAAPHDRAGAEAELDALLAALGATDAR